VDVLFANAGVGSFSPIEQISEADFDAAVAIDFKGVYFTVQKVRARLRIFADLRRRRPARDGFE